MNRNHKLRVILFSIFAAFAATTGCSQGKGESNPGLQAALLSQSSPTLGGARIGVSSAGLGLDDVSRIELTVTGTNISAPIVQELVRAGEVFQGVLLEIPVGTDRIFTAKAYDAGGSLLYQGQLNDVKIEEDQVTLVAMTLQDLSPAPVFGNAAPTISGITVSATSVEPGKTVQIEATASDADGDALTFSWSSPEGSFNPASDAQTVWTAPATSGVQKITLSVSDSHGATVSLSLNLEVAVGPAGHADVTVGVNSAPVVLNILANPTRLDRGESTQLTATVSDPDGDPLTYAWTTDCEGAFHNPALQNTGFDTDDGAAYGSCTLTLTVSDGKGGVNTGSLVIHIVENASQTNNPPLLFDAFQQSLSVEAGETLVFRVRGKDPEGKALTFAWSAPSGTLGASTETPHSTDATQSEIVWTAPSCGGNIRLSVKVTDADNFATTYEYLAVTIIGVPSCLSSSPKRVSLFDSGEPIINGVLDISSREASSYDGRHLVFMSNYNLVTGEYYGAWHIYVRDNQTGKNTLVSASQSGEPANHISDHGTITPDARYVAFASYASNLVPGDTNREGDIFVRDMQTGVLSLVSVSSDGTQANDMSASNYPPSLSGDGRFVLFSSEASNLVAGDTNQKKDAFLHDRQTGITTLVSRATDGTQSNADIEGVSLSGDGRFAVFTSRATNLVAGADTVLQRVYLRDFSTGQTTQIRASTTIDAGQKAQISEDGNTITFMTNSQIYAFNRLTGAVDLISRNSAGVMSDGFSEEPSVSSNGRYVSFSSNATNLDPADTNSWEDIFLHDRQTGITRLVSHGPGGVPGNEDSFNPTLSGNGLSVFFRSNASDLVAGDTNNFADIFRHTMNP